MKKRKLLFTMLALAMGSLMGGSAMAQSHGWDAVYSQTQTTSADWTCVNAGSTTGYQLGQGSATTYYYVDRSLNFTNTNGSGLTIKGTVYLYIPAGITIHCEGSDANGWKGAGAGIELSSGNTLYIVGGGSGAKVIAIGGNAANGSNGAKGENASFSYDTWIKTGAGGNGGDGGGGAGAGIGSRGGAGGVGGAGGAAQQPNYPSSTNGTNGSSGTAGATAGNMGTLYVDQTFGITMEVTGGSGATTGGSGGARGTCAIEDSASKNYSMAGGGGGGGGGYGGAASNVGTGGPGGGGGGGGAGGNQERCSSGYMYVGAPGGKGGNNANGESAGDGDDAYIFGDVQNGYIISNSSWGENDIDFGVEGKAGGPGAGGGYGNVSSNGKTNAGTLKYKVTFSSLRTDLSKVAGLTKEGDYYYKEYAVGAANVVLPKNKDGYQWVLLTYGKSCAPNGMTASEFATASGEYYGGNYTDEADRTILLANVYGDLLFQEVASTMKLEGSGNNDQTIVEFQALSYPITTRLKDRTLYRDNHWNTICLPFAMTPAQIAASPLSGATIYKMDEESTGYYANGGEIQSMHVSYDHPVLLFFFKTVNPSINGIEAGKPYLVKWTEADQFTADGHYKDNTADGNSRHELDFPNVTITKSVAEAWTGAATTFGNIIFQGTFSSSAVLNAGDKTRLILGADDTLYYPSKNIQVGPCRGYFIIPSAAAASAPEIVMGFNDGETTSIKTLSISKSQQEGDAVYNLNGQRLSSLQKGVNIVNGKKVIIK